MKNKHIYYIIGLLLFIIIFLIIIINLFGNHMFTKNHMNTKSSSNGNTLTNLSGNKNDKSLNRWKKEQVENYKYATNLEFGSGNIIDIDLEAKEEYLELVPGIKTKMNTYNSGSIKPLIIRAKKGDKLNINFKNSLQEETTVHWHGVRVPNSQDGVPGITQEAVKVGGTYNYNFVVNDPGTFLFHPHKNHGEQIGRGLYGMLIVEDDNEAKYDKELTWVLKDYRVGKDGKLTDDFPNMHDSMHGGRLGNLVTINNLINYKENISPGDTVRLRLGNLSNARIYNLDFSKLDVKIIATDDSLVNNPKKVSKLELSPGERYDIEIIFPDNIGEIALFDNYFTGYNPVKLATFNIDGDVNNKAEVITPIGDLPDWRDATYNNPDVVIDLGGMGVMGGDKGMMMGMGGKRGWTINDGIHPETSEAIKLKKGEMYIIRMVNNSRRDHPMHLHGDFFQVVNINGMKGELIGFKDTVNVKPLSYVDVAIIPTNAGTWAFHCHILEHADLGMFTTVIVEE